MQDEPQRLYQTKLTLLAVAFIAIGIGLTIAGTAASKHHVLEFLPLKDIGSALFTTGFIGVALQYLDARDAEQRANARLRKVLKEEAPAIRDAVVDGFAFSPESLTSVSSPEVLQRIVRNCLALQLEDAAMAAAVHQQLLDRAFGPNARLFDSRLSVTLGRGPTKAPELLTVTVHREYRSRLPNRTLRFACVGNQDEYTSLLRDPESTEVWLMRPNIHLDAGDEESFALLDVSIDGELQDIRRLSRKGRQVFVAHPSAVDGEDPELRHLAYTFQVLVPRDKRFLYFDFGRPTKGLAVEYQVEADAGVELVEQLDFLGTVEEVRRYRRSVAEEQIELSFACDGWVLPRAGSVMLWRDRTS